MTILVNTASSTIWQEAIRQAESDCLVTLEKPVESYLVSLLMRYSTRPEIAKRVMATAFLEALEQYDQQRRFSLQQVGDQCLIFAGLFPRQAEKRRVNLSYFVDIGQSAYGSISSPANGFFGLLAVQFVLLMDILQSLRGNADLLPLEAYEQWQELGSQRALRILRGYTRK